MPEKNIAWMQENIGDVVETVGIQFYGVSCDGMLSPFFIMDDEDNIPDLCATVDINASLQDYTAIFKRANLTTYEVGAVDFVGHRPPRRPHFPV